MILICISIESAVIKNIYIFEYVNLQHTHTHTQKTLFRLFYVHWKHIFCNINENPIFIISDKSNLTRAKTHYEIYLLICIGFIFSVLATLQLYLIRHLDNLKKKIFRLRFSSIFFFFRFQLGFSKIPIFAWFFSQSEMSILILCGQRKQSKIYYFKHDASKTRYENYLLICIGCIFDSFLVYYMATFLERNKIKH